MGKTYFDPCYFGTDTYWKHPYGLLYTDSVKDFCSEKAAYWTLDVVASYRHVFSGYEFLVLWFDVDENRCSFYAREDTNKPDVIRQEIEYTDMPVSIKLYLCDGILMFPSDY